MDRKLKVVEIPAELVTVLSACGVRRLVMLPPRKKSPPPKGWAEPENQQSPDSPELLNHLKGGGNYAVVGGRGLAVLDTDEPETEEIARTLPSTFTVKTGRGGSHRYYLTDLEKTKPLKIGDKNYGHIRCARSYVVSPGSIHPNGVRYEVADPQPLAYVREDRFREAFADYLRHEKRPPEKTTTPTMPDSGVAAITMAAVISAYGITLYREGSELRGVHPVHGSTTGNNFAVNLDKNVWRCHRCGTGGGPLQLIAVLERIIDCSDARPGGLRGENFMNTLKAAREKGLLTPLTLKTSPQTGRTIPEDKQLLAKYGVTITIGGNGQYVALDTKGKAVFNFQATGSGTERKMRERFSHIPVKIIQEQLATLATLKTAEWQPEKPSDEEVMSMVLDLLEDNYLFVTPEDTEVLYLYRDGVYIPGETRIKGEIEKIMGDDANIGFCREVVEHLKRRSYVPRSDFNRFEGEIPVLNGLLNLKTMQIRDFDPKKIFTFKINTKFDLSKDCPKFKKFFKQILPNSDDRTLLQEDAGYTLLPAFPHHKFMILVGAGRNGKGSFIRTLTGILGRDNVTNIRLEYLTGGHRFMVANLFGVLMNVCSEPSTRKPFKTELLKYITGQDALSGEIKHKQRLLKFTSFAKFFIQANRLPVVDDNTLAFWDRVLIIEFTETFTDEKGNKIADIERAWLDDENERSGILNWLIEGLKRLNENGRFTQTKSMDRKILEFKQASDPIGAFLADPKECIYGSKLWTVRDALYDAYKEYAEALGATIEATRVFNERIRKLPDVVERKKRVKRKNERVWKGIGLIDPTKKITVEDFEEDEPGRGAGGASYQR